MQKINRDHLYSIARHSNWRRQSIDTWFRDEKVYADARSWTRFLQLFLLALGGSFLVSGIVFFFAYNWADMHKFVKLGLLEALLMAVTLLAVFTNWNSTVRNVLLTASVMLTGVLFAVFGQIYQTGANAYDFFLGWTLSVMLWIFLGRFQPLWLIWMGLLNTTFLLYVNQVAIHLAFPVTMDVLFAINVAAVITWEILSSKGTIRNPSRWFPRLLALGAIGPLTISMVMGLYDNLRGDFGVCFMLAAVFYALGLWHGLRTKDIFYLAVIPFSVIIVGAAGIVRLAGSDPVGVFLFACLFVIASITLLVHRIIHVNRKWHGATR